MTNLKEKVGSKACMVAFFITLSFLWTSCGYLKWLYHLGEYVSADALDCLTEVVGYLFQAAGLGIFIAILKRKHEAFEKRFVFSGIVLADLVCMLLSCVMQNTALILLFGYLMNLFHGVIAAIYLTVLAKEVKWNQRALTFGAGYGVASVLSYVLSLLDGGMFLHKANAIVLYFVIAFVSGWVYRNGVCQTSEDAEAYTEKELKPGIVLVIGLTVFMLSLIKSIGFYFPSADISAGVSLEFSRAFYAIGLILAGVINDRSRKFGAISCVIALVFPFAMISLAGELSVSVVLWILGYIFYGFFVVYRVTVFSDLAGMKAEYFAYAGLGLMWGRLGDACGSFTGMKLVNNHVALVSVDAVLFVVALVLFFAMYNALYLIQPKASEKDQLFAFATKYGLSGREKEILEMLIQDLSNSEISEKAFISENTVKFHVRNLLKKTGCSNRGELIQLYKK